jgi:CDP-diacylglycerol---serine O-phosphatidyltransferase
MMKMPVQKRRRGIYLLPNLFTIGALFAGFFAIIAAIRGNFENAAIALFIAMLMDSLDGRVARLTNTMTAFGAELDSLSDMVSFGVAPALFAYNYALSGLGKFGWLVAFIYMVAVSLRLARFNTQIGKVDKHYFQGLACTAGAGFVTSLLWIAVDLEIPRNMATNLVLAFFMIFTALLMVSNIRYRSFKDADFRNHVSFVIILLMVLIIVLISVAPAEALGLMFAIYAISGPVATIWGLRKKKLARATIHKPINEILKHHGTEQN